MRVLHLVMALEVGGLERVVLDLIEGSKGRGVESFLGCVAGRGEWFESANVAGVWDGDMERRGWVRMVWSLMRFLRRERIDVVHTHNPRPHLFGVIAALMAGVPVLHTKHGRNYPDNPRRVWLNRQLSRASRRIVAVSDDVRNVAVDVERVPERKMLVVRNGIGARALIGKEESRKLCGLPRDAYIVGSVGRISVEKNYQLLVRAFAGWAEKCAADDAKLLLVGEGPDRGNVQMMAKEMGIADSVVMPGMQSDVQPWLESMDVFSLSSLSEGTSITLLEACAVGLPAVVTDVGGNGEVVCDGESGKVVPSKDEEKLVEALEVMGAHQRRRQEMGKRGRERVRTRYSLEKMVAEYCRLYGEIAG